MGMLLYIFYTADLVFGVAAHQYMDEIDQLNAKLLILEMMSRCYIVIMNLYNAT